jgi:hypothetical protein
MIAHLFTGAPATFINVDVRETAGHTWDCRRKRAGLLSSGIEAPGKLS